MWCCVSLPPTSGFLFTPNRRSRSRLISSRGDKKYLCEHFLNLLFSQPVSAAWPGELHHTLVSLSESWYTSSTCNPNTNLIVIIAIYTVNLGSYKRIVFSKAHNLHIIIKRNDFALLSKLLFHFKANVNQHKMTPYICPLICLNVGVGAQVWVRFFYSTHPSWGCTLTTSETSTMQWSWWGPGPNAPLLSETSSRTYRWEIFCTVYIIANSYSSLITRFCVCFRVGGSVANSPCSTTCWSQSRGFHVMRCCWRITWRNCLKMTRIMRLHRASCLRIYTVDLFILLLMVLSHR